MQEDLKNLVENNHYRLIKKLGEGGFGVVYTAIKISTGEEVALKVMDLTSEKLYKTFKNEITSTPSHQNILRINTHYIVKSHHRRFGVMELDIMEMDLMDYLLKNRTLSEEETRYIFRQVCEAIACCHENQIFHLDIKADNILISRNHKGLYRNVKLCDFGHARHSSQFRSSAHFGTPQYLPLEMFSKRYPIIAEKVDIWSLGVLLFTLLTGMFPFVINSDQNTIHCLDLAIVNQYCEDNRAIHLLTSIFNEDPTLRPDIFDILSHPWLAVKENTINTYPLEGCVENYYYYNSNNNAYHVNEDKKSKDSKKKLPKMIAQFLKRKNRLSN